MAVRNAMDQRRVATDPAVVSAIEEEIKVIQSLALSEIRERWKKAFQKDAPKALSRDLLIRKLAWHIQELVFGGHDRATLKVLVNYAKGNTNAPVAQRLKPGTEIVREYQGERHTVVITAEGFSWRDEAYPSLTAIARAITGANWNGPRFFGLRESPPGQGGRDRGSAGATKGSGTRAARDYAR